MGTLYQKPIDPLFLHDLKVTLQDSRLLYPFQETKKRSMFLSNIDQVLSTFNVQTADFFPCNPSFPPELVKQRLETALSKMLVTYDFLGGRLKMNPESKRLEIDCNAAGAGFVVGSSEYTLDEIGDLVYPNPAFQQLAVQSLDFLAADDQPLFILQVTSFKCGGFAIGFSVNHVTFDGLGFKMFLDNLASQAFDHEQPLAITPCNDRELLAARSPPRVTFPHHELLELKIPIGDEPLPSAFDPPTEGLAIKLFKLTSNDVARLKETAKGGPTNGTAKITGFNVVTAHVWRCRGLSVDAESDRESTLLYAVNIRPRLRPPLPESYSGNAVLTTYVTARCSELEKGPLSSLVEMVTQGAARMTDEYARSAIDWGSLHKGFPHGEFLLSSWWRLGFMEVEYPWGQPRYSCPIVHHRKDIILLFPDIDKASSNSVNVLVALPPKEMEKFETLFYKFLI